jgi:hypothetical protein
VQRWAGNDFVLLTLQGLIGEAEVVCAGELGLWLKLVVGAENGGVNYYFDMS